MWALQKHFCEINCDSSMVFFKAINSRKLEERLPTMPVDVKEFFLWIGAYPYVPCSELGKGYDQQVSEAGTASAKVHVLL